MLMLRAPLKVAIGTVGGLALIALLGGAIAIQLAADDGDASLVHACEHNEVGIVILVGETEPCPDSENWESRHWSIQGEPGPPGTSLWNDGDGLVTTDALVGIASSGPTSGSKLAVGGAIELTELKDNTGNNFFGPGCGDNERVSRIHADGTIECVPNTITGDITGVSGGTGLMGGGIEGDVTLTADTNYLQRRVSTSCAVGSSIRLIRGDGTVDCEADDQGAPSGWAFNLEDEIYTGVTPQHNVGIGTTNPNEKLDVNGSVAIYERVGIGRTTASPTAELVVQDGRIHAGRGADIPDDPWIKRPTYSFHDVDSSGITNIGSGANQRLVLVTEGRERLVIKFGDVGIGTADPRSALHVNGYIQLDTATVAPPAVDCDEATERGRMKVDSASGSLYVCVDTGWIAK